MIIRIGEREFDPGDSPFSVTFDDRDIEIISGLKSGAIYAQIPTFHALDTAYMEEVHKTSDAVRVENFDEEVESLIQAEEIQYTEMTPILAVKRFWKEFPYRRSLLALGGILGGLAGVGSVFLFKLIVG